MKKLLFTLILILGFNAGCTQQADSTSNKEAVAVVAGEPDKGIIEVLEKSVLSGDFGDDFASLFADSITYVSTYSGEVYEGEPKSGIVEYFERVITPDIMVDAVVGHFEESGYDIYSIEFLFIAADEDGNPVIGSILWFLIEDGGKIIEVYGP